MRTDLLRAQVMRCALEPCSAQQYSSVGESGHVVGADLRVLRAQSSIDSRSAGSAKPCAALRRDETLGQAASPDLWCLCSLLWMRTECGCDVFR